MQLFFRNQKISFLTKEAIGLRYKYEVIGGYVYPLIVTFITILVDRNYSEQCSDIRPRFEEMCFFAGIQNFLKYILKKKQPQTLWHNMYLYF